MSKPPILYRLVDFHDTVQLETYVCVSATRCGVWIRVRDKLRFVNLQATKKFANPTLEEAKEAFIRRKARQLGILNAQLRNVETVKRRVESGESIEELYRSPSGLDGLL